MTWPNGVIQVYGQRDLQTGLFLRGARPKDNLESFLATVGAGEFVFVDTVTDFRG
jgi:hypothetical protein